VSRSPCLEADEPRDGFGAGEEHVEIALRVFLGEHLAEATAEGGTIRIADDSETNFVLPKLLKDCASLTGAQVEEARGKTGSVQKNGVRAVGEATLESENRVGGSAHEAVMGLGLYEATPELLHETERRGTGLRMGSVGRRR
jgi:hypothetical protein